MPSINCPICGREVRVKSDLIADNNHKDAYGNYFFQPFEFSFKCHGEQLVRDFNS